MSVSMARLFPAILIAALACSGAAVAQDYPTRPVKIIVGAAPGATGDLTSRMLAQYLTQVWKQPLVVENHSGGSGLLSANMVQALPGDGYTLYVSNDSMATNQAVLQKPPPAPPTIWAPVSLLAIIDFVLIVPANSPYKTVKDLIAAAKAAPGKLNFSSAGQYTPHHLMSELFKHQAGIDVVHVPYRGTPDSITAVVTGTCDFAFAAIGAASAQMTAGTVRALGSTGSKRNAATPNIPTIAEAGLPEFDASSWWALQVRADVPPTVQARIAAGAQEAIADPTVHERLLRAGLDPVGSTPKAYAEFLQNQIKKWKSLPDGVIAKQ